jgi:hypothetical protein
VKWRSHADIFFPSIEVPPTACEVLDEFYGVRCDGISVMEFNLAACEPIADYIAKINAALRAPVYPVGDTNDGGGTYVLISSTGRAFWFFDAVEYLGDSIDSALEYLLAREPRTLPPLAPPDLEPGKWPIQ